MNPYFLVIYVLSVVFEGWSPASLLSTALSIIKYVRIFISMFIPEPKGTVESRRGFIKITYYADDGDGMEKKYVLLPTGGPEKMWTKVEAVRRVDYLEHIAQQEELERKLLLEQAERETSLELPQIESPHIEFLDETAAVGPLLPSITLEDSPSTLRQQSIPPPVADPEKNDEDDILADIDGIASGRDKVVRSQRKRSELPKKSALVHKYKDCPKVNVTRDVLLLAGPNKDFFKVQLSPKDLDSSYQALIFHYGKHQKTFDTADLIVFP